MGDALVEASNYPAVDKLGEPKCMSELTKALGPIMSNELTACCEFFNH